MIVKEASSDGRRGTSIGETLKGTYCVLVEEMRHKNLEEMSAVKYCTSGAAAAEKGTAFFKQVRVFPSGFSRGIKAPAP